MPRFSISSRWGSSGWSMPISTRFNTNEWIDELAVISDDPDDRIVHHTIKTPDGELTYKTAGDRKTTWITEHLIKQDEDIELIRKYMPVPEPRSRADPRHV